MVFGIDGVRRVDDDGGVAPCRSRVDLVLDLGRLVPVCVHDSGKKIDVWQGDEEMELQGSDGVGRGAFVASELVV